MRNKKERKERTELKWRDDCLTRKHERTVQIEWNLARVRKYKGETKIISGSVRANNYDDETTLSFYV